MATLYIDEYSGEPSQNQSNIQVVSTPRVTNQTVAIGGSSTASAAFNAATKIIRVHTDSICSIAVGGAAPTAAVTNARMIAGQTEYFGVVPGDKIAVIANT